ncbi:MAG: helix-turn-helix domain-containing protein [Pseudomonadota bacterium]
MLEDQTQSLTPEEAIYVGDTMGGRIVAAREATGHTTAQLARRLGIKSATLQNWENDRAEPRSNKLFMLAGMLNVSPTWILTGRGESPTPIEGDPDIAALRHELLDMRSRCKRLLDQIDRTVKSLSE